MQSPEEPGMNCCGQEHPGHPSGLRVEERSDEVLLRAFAIGAQEPALAFIRRFQARVYGIALAVSGDSNHAQEIAVSVFEHAAQNVRAYDRRRSSVATWMAGLAGIAAIDAIADRNPRQALPSSVRPVPSSQTAAPEAEPREEPHAKLHVALHELPTDEARTLVLASIAGLSIAQIAFSEGIPVRTARMRLRTAMHCLRRLLILPETEATFRQSLTCHSN